MTTIEILQGIKDWTNGKIVYDISVAHPDGQGNPTPYTDLTSALGTGGANIPESLRKGGMSIKFIQGTVQSSDNKYVQYRYMGTEVTGNPNPFLVEGNWEETDGSVKVAASSAESDLDISDENGNVLARFENGHFKVKNFDSADTLDSIQAILSNIGFNNVPEFSEEEDYAIGDIVRYGKLVYVFTSAHTAGEWDASEVEETVINKEHPIDVTDSSSEADFDISDEDENVLVRFANGHFKVKNFDSEECKSDIENLYILANRIDSKNLESCLVESTRTFQNGWTTNGFTITNKATSTTNNAILESNKDFGQDARLITWMFKATTNSTKISLGTNFVNNSFASELIFDFLHGKIEIYQKRTSQITKSVSFALQPNIIYSVDIIVSGRSFMLRIYKQVTNKSAEVLEKVFQEIFINPNFGYTTYNNWGYKYGSWKGHSYLSLTSGGIEVYSYRHSLLNKKNPYLYLVGDSITEGMGCQDYEKYGDILRRQYGFDNVSISGIGSETTSRVISRLNNEILFIKPKISLVYLGTNTEDSSSFRSRYATIISTLKTVSDYIIICTIPSNQSLGNIVRELAVSENVLLCDFDFLYDNVAENYNDYDMTGTLYNDGIHPNGIGQSLMATEICATILNNNL